MVILLWLYSFYRLWMVWAYTLNFDGVSLLFTSLVHSHWSRNVEARLSLVESFIVMLRQLIGIGGFHVRKGPIIGALIP